MFGVGGPYGEADTLDVAFAALTLSLRGGDAFNFLKMISFTRCPKKTLAR